MTKEASSSRKETSVLTNEIMLSMTDKTKLIILAEADTCGSGTKTVENGF
jgi:hypothetical protein